MEITQQSAAQIEEAELRLWVKKEQIDHNVDGTITPCYQEFGGPVGFITPGKNSLYNRVLGFKSSDIGKLDDILSWYKDFGVECRIDIAPPLASKNIFSILQERGFSQHHEPYISRRVLYGEPYEKEISSEPIDVHEISANESDLYFDLMNEEWPVESDYYETFKEKSKQELLVGYPRRFLCIISGNVVAAGELLMHEGVAYLSGAATRPQYRKLGCQTLLINERMKVAYQSGCNVAFMTTTVNSDSQRNMERAGLRLGYDREVWVQY